jgi:membrane protein DedA with SNARE-associated domain
MAAIHIHLHHFFHHLFHHRFHGPPFDYVGLAFGAFVSSAGLPGPGEALLIAGGIIAASGRLDISSVIAVAFVGATAGGIAGWLLGLKAGRTLMSAPGPFQHARARALARGDRIFHRYVALAVIMTPAWVAGIHHVRPRTYQLWNAVGAALWAVGVGLGAYYAGPPVVDVVGDIGWATLGIVGAVVVGAIVGGQLRRWRAGQRGGQTPSPGRGAPEEQGSLERGSPMSPAPGDGGGIR